MQADESVAETSTQSPEKAGIARDLRHCGCGILMGAADVVPGVSGGTVALITGVYGRLITAISRADSQFLRLLAAGNLTAAAQRIDIRFAGALGCGILAGAGGLASVMETLLRDSRPLTYAAFSGMILASSLLVARRVHVWDQLRIGLMLLAGLFAWWLARLPALQNPPDTSWYLFACGAIGISAMILPGISGAFILLLLSRYDTVLDAVRNVTHLNLSGETLVTVTVFGAGCVCGLALFTRVLRRLLTTFHDSTVSVLAGFMLGSLYRIWPFQHDLSPEIEDLKLKMFEHYLPAAFSNEVWAAVCVSVVSGGMVLALDALAQRFGSEAGLRRLSARAARSTLAGGQSEERDTA